MMVQAEEGRILVHIMGPCTTGIYKWESETLEWDGNGAERISDGVGFDYFYDSLDFPNGPGFYLITDILVTYHPGDGWEMDADEGIEVGSICPVPADFTLQPIHPLNILTRRCRQANDTWWRDPVTGTPLPSRNKGELIALIHSEISEALEGLRKNLQDDHLPEFPMELVEMADALIRIFDYVGEYYPASENDNGVNLGNAFEKKMAYNAQRKDHKPESRAVEGGKKF